MSIETKNYYSPLSDLIPEFLDLKEECNQSSPLTPHEARTALSIYGPETVVARLIAEGGDLTILNEPNHRGITPIHILSRNGRIDLLKKIFNKLNNEIALSPNAHYDTATHRTCTALSDELLLSELPLDQIEFSPLTVAQNFCTTAIRLKNGKLLTLNNSDSSHVYRFLMEKKYGKKGNRRIKGSTLTAYLNPGHAFLNLECKSCDRTTQLVGFSFQDSILGGSTSLPHKMGALPFGTGSVFHDGTSLAKSDSNNFPKVTFHLTEKQAKAALKEIKGIAASCKGIHEKKKNRCVYELWSNNCVDFVNRIYQKTGARGHFSDFFTDDQLIRDMHKLFPNAGAAQYAYAQSRGFTPYIQAQFGSPQTAPFTTLSLLNGTEKAIYPSAQFNSAQIESSLSINSALIALAGYYILSNTGAALYSFGKSLWQQLRNKS